jgi:hypothetical protein
MPTDRHHPIEIVERRVSYLETSRRAPVGVEAERRRR